MRTLWLTLAAVSCSFAARAEAPKIESFSLSNGLEVIVIENHRVPAVNHTLWLRVGAADDPPGKSGLAHYHEHMMFQGTQHYPAGEYANTIERNGGRHNAFTGFDATAYYVDIAKEHLPLVMELEADRMRALTATEAQAKKEREVIIEERRTRIENSPAAQMNEQTSAAMFLNHPYGIPIIGWKHEMEGLTRQDVLDFHARYYAPNNAILILSGDVTLSEIRPLVERYYGELKRQAIPERRWKSEPPPIAARRVTLTHAQVKHPTWQRAWLAPSMGDPNRDAVLPLLVFKQYAGGGKTSALYQSLVVEQKLASSVALDYDGFSIGPSQFLIRVIPQEGVGLDTLERAVDDALKKLLETPIPEADFARAKTLLKAETIYAREGLQSFGMIMGWLRIVGLDKDYFNRWPELIEAVHPDQAMSAARGSLLTPRSVTSLLLPEQAHAPTAP